MRGRFSILAFKNDVSILNRSMYPLGLKKRLFEQNFELRVLGPVHLLSEFDFLARIWAPSPPVFGVPSQLLFGLDW